MNGPFLAAPLRGWTLGPMDLGRGLRIAAFRMEEWPELAWVNRYIEASQWDEVLEARTWLVSPDPAQLKHGISAMTVLAPGSVNGLSFVVERRRVMDIDRFPSFSQQRWAWEVGPANLRRLELVRWLTLVRDWEQSDAARLANPVHLLVHGLESRSQSEAALLWTTALSALFSTSDPHELALSLEDCLGPESGVFPPDANGFRPAYSVGQMAPDVAQLGESLKDGKLIPGPFRRMVPFLVEYRGNSASIREMEYLDLVTESALYLLCGSLQRTGG
jgi:hypothetical protein